MRVFIAALVSSYFALAVVDPSTRPQLPMVVQANDCSYSVLFAACGGTSGNLIAKVEL